MRQRDIFTAALQITDPEERSAYLGQACGGDAELRRRVEVLLRTHESVGDFLGRTTNDALRGQAARKQQRHPEQQPARPMSWRPRLRSKKLICIPRLN